MHGSVEVDVEGLVCEATWRAGDYDRLTVESAFGSTYAYGDGRDPAALARSLLAELVRRAQKRSA